MKKTLLGILLGLTLTGIAYAGIPISSNFSPSFQLPIDDRIVATSTTQRDSLPTVERYEGLTVFTSDTSQNWQLQGGITNSDWIEIATSTHVANYWSDDGTTLTPATSTRNVSTTGYISGGLNSVFGSATEYLTVSTRDLVGGGLFNAPLLQFTNSNSIGQSTKIGVIDNGLYLSDADNGQPTIGFFSGTAMEPYGLLQYSTSTQTMRLNTYQNDTTQEYFDFGKISIGGDFYPMITGMADNGDTVGLATKDSLIISGNSPILGFYDIDDDAYNIMQMSADGLLSLGGLSAVRMATSTETGLKEVVNIGGAFFVPSPATKTCSVYQDSYNTSGFARTARMGAVCGIRNETGEDDWIGGVSIETFSTSTGSSTPVTRANFKPTETDFYAGTSTSRYFRISELDMSSTTIGDAGKYPLLSGYSDGGFGNIISLANSISIYDTADDDLTSLNFVGNEVSSIGILEYDNQTLTFNFQDLLGNANVSMTGDLIVKGGHITLEGTDPTLSSCGTSPAITGSDTSGVITEGTIATGCSMAFATPWANDNVACVVTSRSGLVFSYTVSSTTLAITNVGALSGTKLDYHCFGNN